MSTFDFSTLITDRTEADVNYVKYLASLFKPDIEAGEIVWTGTDEELAVFNNAMLKGAYNYTDLNRVTAAMEYLDETLRKYGYVTGYQRLEIPHTGVSSLPNGYTQVEYIESSGTQYIDTGFKPNNNTRVVTDAEYLSTAGTNPVLFGARTAASSKTYVLMYTSGNFRSDYNNVYTQTWSAALTDRRVFDKNKETTTIDGVSQSYTNAAFQCDYNLYLLGLNNAGTAQWFPTARLYSCQIYDNDELIRNYVPCTNADGTAGLYDLVNGAFYANAGTGSFTAGEPIELPEETEKYDEYTWIETDIPTESQMAQYLSNVLAICSTILTEPELPETIAKLDYNGANQIEQVLMDLDKIINVMTTTFVPCGEAICGGDNL